MAKGKKSIDTKFQEKLGKGLFDLIREYCRGCASKEQAADTLSGLTDGKIKINPQTLWVLIHKPKEGVAL